MITEKYLTPEEFSLDDIFKGRYIIPVYQRPYSWGDKQVNAKENIRSPYVLGNNVYIETNLSSDYIILFAYKAIDEMGLETDDLHIIVEQ